MDVDLAQWLVWRQETRDGKPTKVPYRADGRGKARSTDPSTWSSYADAKAAVERGVGEGLGFVLAPDDPYVGVDLDGCVDEDGRIDPAAAEIVARLDSYTEFSPGDGLHVFLRGRVPGDRHTTTASLGDEFAVYDRGRYFTVTGRHVSGTPKAIEERQEELEAVYAELLPAPTPVVAGPRPLRALPALADRDLIEKAMAAKNGHKFAALWQGNWEDQYASQSEADVALCGMLAFWTGPDPGQIDGLFRQSGLMREKWEKREDYRERTLTKATSGLREHFGDGRNGTNGAARKPPSSGPVAYELEWRVSEKGKCEIVLPPLPDPGEVAGLRAWLTAVFGLNPAQPIIRGWRTGTLADGGAVLERRGAPELWFTPFSRLCAPNKLLESLNACMAPEDGVAPPLKGEHCPLIAAAVRRLCETGAVQTMRELAQDAIRLAIQDAEAVHGLTTYGLTSAQRFEVATALSRKPTGWPRYLVDSNTGEFVVRASDVTHAVRALKGTGLRHGEVVDLMGAVGWAKIDIDGHQLPGREGRRGPHAIVSAWRGHLTSTEEGE
jgi:hypothetical protein